MKGEPVVELVSLGQIAYEAWVAAKRTRRADFYAVPWSQILDRDAWETLALRVSEHALEAFVAKVVDAQASALADLRKKAA